MKNFDSWFQVELFKMYQYEGAGQMQHLKLKTNK